ncbi:MAG TPA: hypothetical protein VJL35_14810 [Gemmatimonadaceae bacterium]|nr:hypothetical protein [Gemmatimonadaceae bacterium]
MPKKHKPTGRKPEILKIEGNWKDAVAHALKKGKPPAVPKKKRKTK